MDKTKAEAREQGFVRTLCGRRCYVPEINAKIPSRRAYAERAAINAPIQGTAADIMKRAMVRAWRALRRELPEVRMLLQVHDELVFEVPEALVEPTAALIAGRWRRRPRSPCRWWSRSATGGPGRRRIEARRAAGNAAAKPVSFAVDSLSGGAFPPAAPGTPAFPVRLGLR